MLWGVRVLVLSGIVALSRLTAMQIRSDEAASAWAAIVLLVAGYLIAEEVYPQEPRP